MAADNSSASGSLSGVSMHHLAKAHSAAASQHANACTQCCSECQSHHCKKTKLHVMFNTATLGDDIHNMQATSQPAHSCIALPMTVHQKHAAFQVLYVTLTSTLLPLNHTAAATCTVIYTSLAYQELLEFHDKTVLVVKREVAQCCGPHNRQP